MRGEGRDTHRVQNVSHAISTIAAFHPTLCHPLIAQPALVGAGGCEHAVNIVKLAVLMTH